MRSRERLAGFCFQFAQTDFLCVCVSSLSGNSLQTGTSCRNCHFQGKNTLQRRFVPFSFPRAPCAWPRNAPTVPCHSAAPPVLHELGAQRGSSEPGGWTRRWVWPGAGSWLGISSPGGAGMRGQPGAGRSRPRCVASCSPLALSLAAADAACLGTTCLHTALQNGQAAPGRAIWGHLLLAGPASAHPLPPVSPCSVPSSTGQTLSHPDRHMKFAGPAVRAGRQGGSQECEVK